MRRAFVVCYVKVLVVYHVDKTGACFVSISSEVLLHFSEIIPELANLVKERMN